MILDKIIETKNDEVGQLKKHTTEAALKKSIAELPACRNFEKAISAKDCSVIAEVKCSSPSRGRLIADFDPLRIAAIYEQNGAAVISVLTDEKYFCGHKDYLTRIKKQVGLPVLRKDFIIDPLQIYETRAIGADAVLLIARVLGQKLTEYILLAKELGLSALVEVHTEKELDLALAAGAKIIGINNRNLETFVTDINTSRELMCQIPADAIVVAESGIVSRADIDSLMQSGIYSFLIGEALITAPDIGKKLRELRG
ncbi:MAG: indole-3-glycerol phosphate synthase [Deltaproteobacteria bacterium RBG_19FT_COMBO_43_11]|nr:MAG: indole-3-glycerol phosphate synthase [Deltaproteobacteria bacterium RBG_19FT_COMBO_43_11]